MLKKIYIGVLGFSIACMAFFAYYSWSWLQSIGLPAAAVEGYEYHANLGWMFLWISSIALLFLGNGVLWTTRSSWAMWTAFAYFAVFILLGYFWLDRSAFEFKKDSGLLTSNFTVRPLIGVLLVAAAGILVFVDQFVAVRLFNKMYPPAVAAEPAEEPGVAEE